MNETQRRPTSAHGPWTLLALMVCAHVNLGCSDSSSAGAGSDANGNGTGGTGGSLASSGTGGTSCGPDCSDPDGAVTTGKVASTATSSTVSTSSGGAGVGGSTDSAAAGGTSAETAVGGNGGSSSGGSSSVNGSAGAAGEANEVEPTAMAVCPDGQASSCPSSDPLCAERTGAGTAATSGGSVYTMSSNYTFCTHFCESVAEYHIDTAGASATQKCGSFDGSDNVCYLDCSLGRSCPEGFECRGDVCMYKHCTCSGDCEGRTCL